MQTLKTIKHEPKYQTKKPLTNCTMPLIAILQARIQKPATTRTKISKTRRTKRLLLLEYQDLPLRPNHRHLPRRRRPTHPHISIAPDRYQQEGDFDNALGFRADFCRVDVSHRRQGRECFCRYLHVGLLPFLDVPIFLDCKCFLAVRFGLTCSLTNEMFRYCAVLVTFLGNLQGVAAVAVMGSAWKALLAVWLGL